MPRRMQDDRASRSSAQGQSSSCLQVSGLQGHRAARAPLLDLQSSGAWWLCQLQANVAAPRAAFPHVFHPGHLQGSSLQVSAANLLLLCLVLPNSSKFTREKLGRECSDVSCFHITEDMFYSNFTICRHFKEKMRNLGRKEETKWNLLVCKVLESRGTMAFMPERRKKLSILTPAGSCHVAPLVGPI